MPGPQHPLLLPRAAPGGGAAAAAAAVAAAAAAPSCPSRLALAHGAGCGPGARALTAGAAQSFAAGCRASLARRALVCRASGHEGNGNGSPNSKEDHNNVVPGPDFDKLSTQLQTDPELWMEGAEFPVPAYLQSTDDMDFCKEWAEERRNLSVVSQDFYDPVWDTVLEEAKEDAQSEPMLSSYLYASILSHSSFERSLAFILANRLADPTLLATQLVKIFIDVLEGEPEVSCSARADLVAVRERDPACQTFAGALLYFKGYHAVQAHRISHALWNRGQTVMAHALQSRVSEVLSCDIHPAARLGKGLLMDHGSGVVIGETAVVGDNVSLLQGVTLGGTGKEGGDRHPKVEPGVLVGAHATILGNIKVGKGAMIAAGSLVLKEVEPYQMMAGAPAKPVGKVRPDASFSMRSNFDQKVRRKEGGGQGSRVNFSEASLGSDNVPLPMDDTSTSGMDDLPCPASQERSSEAGDKDAKPQRKKLEGPDLEYHL